MEKVHHTVDVLGFVWTGGVLWRWSGAHWRLGWAVVARGGDVLFSVHCVYFLWVRGYWSGELQTSRSKEEGREVSNVGRKVARLTRQQWLVIGLLTSLLAMFFPFIQTKFGLDGSR